MRIDSYWVQLLVVEEGKTPLSLGVKCLVRQRNDCTDAMKRFRECGFQTRGCVTNTSTISGQTYHKLFFLVVPFVGDIFGYHQHIQIMKTSPIILTFVKFSKVLPKTQSQMLQLRSDFQNVG